MLCLVWRFTDCVIIQLLPNTDGISSKISGTRSQDVLTIPSNWLLQRVIHKEWLRKDFCSVGRITLGQPARGAEITELRHSNNMFHQNMFLEDGLVALVTSSTAAQTPRRSFTGICHARLASCTSTTCGSSSPSSRGRSCFNDRGSHASHRYFSGRTARMHGQPSHFLIFSSAKQSQRLARR